MQIQKKVRNEKKNRKRWKNEIEKIRKIAKKEVVQKRDKNNIKIIKWKRLKK